MTDREALRNRVLAEAEIVLGQEGFFGLSMRQVALNVGIHPGTMSSLFGSKRELLRTVEARVRDKQQARSIPALVTTLMED